ncbi:MAG: DUF814 domain-containing protein [Bacteroidia bacterium]|nr:DUF814 domain-containing protein [Bacteroidia bacterium]
MYSSCFIYHRIAKGLSSELAGAAVTSAFSTGKDELILQFEADNKAFQIAVKFADGEMYFRFYDQWRNEGRNAIPQFKPLIGAYVVHVEAYPFDRCFYMEFNNQYKLFFKGYGRMGNVLLYAPDEAIPLSVFRQTHKKDAETLLPKLDSKAELNLGQITDEKTLKKTLPFLSPEQVVFLIKKGFLEQGIAVKSAIWQELLKLGWNGELHQNNDTDPPQLALIPDKTSESIGNGLQGLDLFAKNHLWRFYFIKEKNQRMASLQASIKQYERLEKDNVQKLELLQNRRNYRELGDIILSYAHSIKPGVSNALLTDYYTGNPIRIKLDPKISAAENAEKYYRKAKNEHLEAEKITDNIEKSRKMLAELRLSLEKTEAASAFSGLDITEKAKSANPQQDNKPYKELEILGYTVWLGKNAKSNDQMLKLSAKNDMWLHAREIQGSHVIVRKKHEDIPAAVLQLAANLAAKHSKAKGHGVVPVLVLERKFVVKGKNALPGEVKLLKEHVVDAFPEEAP